MSFTCDETRERLSAHADGELDPDDQADALGTGGVKGFGNAVDRVVVGQRQAIESGDVGLANQLRGGEDAIAAIAVGMRRPWIMATTRRPT